MAIKELPMPATLNDSYEFVCTVCAHSQLAAPSIFMSMGINTGGGECMSCGLSHHLEIDIETDTMMATPMAEWFELVKTEMSQ